MKRHGISIGIDRVDDSFQLYLKAVGKLTHDDYQVISPMLDQAVAGIPSATIRACIDLTEFEGWELRAAWDDFRLGLKHGKEFEKIAIIGNRKWHDVATRVGSWFISGSMEYFEDEDAALNWLHG